MNGKQGLLVTGTYQIGVCHSPAPLAIKIWAIFHVSPSIAVYTF